MMDAMLTDLYRRLFTTEAELDVLYSRTSGKESPDTIEKAELKAKIELLNQLVSTRTDQLRD